MRDTIAPIPEDYTIKGVINGFDGEFEGMSFEVMSIDGENLVQDTTIDDWTEKGEEISFSMEIEPNIDNDTEYILIITLLGENKKRFIIHSYNFLQRSRLSGPDKYVKTLVNAHLTRRDLMKYLLI
jgi:hypothetical protein